MELKPVLLIVFSCLGLRGAEPALTPDLEEALNVAIDAKEKQIRPKDYAEPDRTTPWWRHGVAFNDALARLSAAPKFPLDQQEDTLRAKLITIARDRKERPEVYTELEKFYCDRTDLVQFYAEKGYGPRAILAPDLRPEHTTEKYRLAWEYLLLRPKMENYLELCGHRALEAVVTIHNDKSLITLIRCFEFCVGKTTQRISDEEEQKRFISAIMAFQNEKALEATLHCIARSKNQLRTEDRSPDEQWDLEKWVTEVVSSSKNASYRANWKAVIQAYSDRAKALPAKERGSLHALAQAFSKTPP